MNRSFVKIGVIALFSLCAWGCFPDDYLDDRPVVEKPNPKPAPKPDPQPDPDPTPEPDSDPEEDNLS